MGVILSVLGVILLVFATVLALVLLALILPVRFGIKAQGDMAFDEGVANVRIYGGVIGGGFRIRRNTSNPATPWRATLGLMLWRWFVPVYSRNVGSDSKEPKPRKSPPDSTPFAPDDFDASDIVASDEPNKPAETADRTDTTSEPPEPPRPEPVETAEPAPRETARKTESRPRTVTRTEAKAAKRVEPKQQSTKQRGKSARQKLRETIARVRALYAEWWPVFTGVLRRLRGVLRVTQFHIDGELGLNDPAITGQMVGYLTAMRGLSVKNGFLARIGLDRGALRISVSPSFDGYVLRGRIAAELRLSLARIWWAGLFAGWKVFRRYRAMRTREARTQNSGSSTVAPSMAA
jgi:hypothetical protein